MIVSRVCLCAHVKCDVVIRPPSVAVPVKRDSCE